MINWKYVCAAILLVASLTLLGKSLDQVMKNDAAKEPEKFLTYERDTDTGLCFAYRNIRRSDALFTNVPCTPEVLNNLKKVSK